MYARRRVTTIPEGDPVPDGVQVEMRLHADNSLIATESTQNGWFTFSLNGNPGPHYFTTTYEGETHISSSQAVGISGTVDIYNLPTLIKSFRSGYVDTILDELRVTAAGTGMQVRVGAGAGYYRGILYDQAAPVYLPIDAADTQARIDRICVEVVSQGAGTDIEGRSRLVVLKGTPASTPSPPAQSSTDLSWHFALADVLVDANVAAIASNKITDRRVQFGAVLPVGSVERDMLAPEAMPGVMVQLEGTQIAEHARMLAFGTNDFLLTRSAAGEDYTTPNRPYVRIDLNRASLLEWLEDALVIDVPEPDAGTTSDIFRWKDENFPASGTYGGGFATIPGATATITLPAGNWTIETELNMTIRGSGSGAQCTMQLTGDATPQGAAISQRIFPVASGTYNSITLSGRRDVSHSVAKTYTANAQRSHQSGALVDFRDGVVRMKAYRR